MFKRSTPESRVQARKDAVAIGATQMRLQARVGMLQARLVERVQTSKATAPVVVSAFYGLFIVASDAIESIRL